MTEAPAIEWQTWRCWGCGRILAEYSLPAGSRVRVRCHACHAWNWLQVEPCPLCGPECHGVVVLAARGRG